MLTDWIGMLECGSFQVGKISKYDQNSPNWAKNDQNGQNWPKMLQTGPKMSKMPKWAKFSKTQLPTYFKSDSIIDIVPDTKWSKIAQIAQNGQK